jgi:hypothetical protein
MTKILLGGEMRVAIVMGLWVRAGLVVSIYHFYYGGLYVCCVLYWEEESNIMND